MIKAIIFDLDNSLLDFVKMKRFSVRAAVTAMNEAGLGVDEKKAFDDIFDLYLKSNLPVFSLNVKNVVPLGTPEDIIKTRDLKGKIQSFDISSKKKIILISKMVMEFNYQ